MNFNSVMSTLIEIEATADALSPADKQELLLFLAARLREQGGRLGYGVTRVGTRTAAAGFAKVGAPHVVIIGRVGRTAVVAVSGKVRARLTERVAHTTQSAASTTPSWM